MTAYLPNFQLPKISLSSLESGVNSALNAAVNNSHELTRFAFQGVFTWIFAATFLGTIENTLERKFPELAKRIRTYCDTAAEKYNASIITSAKRLINASYHPNFDAGVAQAKAGPLAQAANDARSAVSTLLGNATACVGESDEETLARILNEKSDAELQKISGQGIIGEVGDAKCNRTEDEAKKAATARGILTRRIQMRSNPFYYSSMKKIVALIFAGIASSYMMDRNIGNGFLAAGLLWIGASHVTTAAPTEA